jgi:MoaA/NifB/PqqE/SkfB family radical SAM enzyme
MKSPNFEFLKLGSLVYNNLRNMLAIQIYKHLKIDFTYPIKVNAQLNNACNSKCNMCDVWRQDHKELPASVWINALNQLKSGFGNLKVSFAGGEVLLKQDVYEIFEFCNDAGLPFGITTNGKLLNPDNIQRLLELKPMNINISIDSLNKEVYRNIRGVSFLESVKSNIDYLMMYIEKKSMNTKVFFKTVVNNLNLTELQSIAKYASEKKVAGITFDPVRRRRKIFLEEKIDAFENMANIDQKNLSEAKQCLVELKKSGINILNSEKSINQWFNDNENSYSYFCEAPLRDILINNEGFVRLCDYTDNTIGNIVNDDIRLILKKEEVKNEKRRLTNCNNPCVYCIHRNVSDYAQILLSYVKHQRTSIH